MEINECDLGGLFKIELTPFADNRGSFSRTYCAREFAKAGINLSIVQSNWSVNNRRGTLRGLHYQAPCDAEVGFSVGEGKVVQCIRGSIFDVVVDLRRNSPTFLHWQGFELAERLGTLLYVPPGFAHGFQTLEDDTHVVYLMTEYYRPELSAGCRWNDPCFGIDWPIASPIISDKDRDYPDFRPESAPFFV